MIIFKIIISLFILFVFVNLILQRKKDKLTTNIFLMWSLLWIAIAIIFWKPDLASYLAIKLGIGRGSDLIIYISIISIFYILFKILAKIHNLESQITKVVREVAIKNNEKENE